jgi:hypothetical protein
MSSLTPGGCMLLGLALAGALDHLLHGHILELGPLPEPRGGNGGISKISGREFASSLEGISS